MMFLAGMFFGMTVTILLGLILFTWWWGDGAF